MSGKAGLGIGLLIGVIFAIAGSITTMMIVSAEMDDRQSAAYERGFDDAMTTLKRDGEKIGSHLNDMILQENERLQRDITDTRTGLQVIMARDDVPQAVKDQLANIVNDLPE